MVFYFTSDVVEPPAFIYVGKDKEESSSTQKYLPTPIAALKLIQWLFVDEDLIKYGLENDVWVREMRHGKTQLFHVDNLSSAHVYLRLNEGQTWEDIPPKLLEDCAQLTKANSIEGNKKDNVSIIYTPWSNLLKSASMATGQVSFHSTKQTKKIFVPARQNPIVNRLNKTKVEKHPDLKAEKEEHLAKIRKEQRKVREEKRTAEKKERREREELKWQKEHAYDDLMSEENVVQSNNQDRDESYLDDFM
ncbi:hypothetical protein LOZ61_006264 [Ophidiomyces ophidiicola]|nr:hypothetical protein LOZ61_006264 [Ophidiomyces ophidiicola]KAI1930224.1 hypothetical protein LOZ60_001007 [Ophidiomyces ophidiicola]KAI1968165.1 hypothetical protein LOZ59_000526 [Ophidiomyces ophidiicola]KAI1969342.1 hypothetical protein LOZ56_004501 [Ophidiomyces ophidiicola]KAI2005177.1 hypothetical protein LOZ49_005537 [Ophidiomyces ophidiicola]